VDTVNIRDPRRCLAVIGSGRNRVSGMDIGEDISVFVRHCESSGARRANAGGGYFGVRSLDIMRIDGTGGSGMNASDNIWPEKKGYGHCASAYSPPLAESMPAKQSRIPENTSHRPHPLSVFRLRQSDRVQSQADRDDPGRICQELSPQINLWLSHAGCSNPGINSIATITWRLS
jgi:hypothetical protein